MDEVDCTQLREERQLKECIDNNRLFGGLNKTGECIDCGENIPEARIKAVPGCERCVVCQEIYEGREKA